MADRRGRPRFPWVAVILAALTIPLYFLIERVAQAQTPNSPFPDWLTLLERVSQQSPKVRLFVSPVVPGGKDANPVLQVEVAAYPTHFQGVLFLRLAA